MQILFGFCPSWDCTCCCCRCPAVVLFTLTPTKAYAKGGFFRGGLGNNNVASHGNAMCKQKHKDKFVTTVGFFFLGLKKVSPEEEEPHLYVCERVHVLRQLCGISSFGQAKIMRIDRSSH